LHTITLKEYDISIHDGNIRSKHEEKLSYMITSYKDIRQRIAFAEKKPTEVL